MAKAARKRATRSGWRSARVKRPRPAKAVTSGMLSPHDQTARMSIWRNVLSQVLRDLGDRSPVIVAQAWRWVRSKKYEEDRREVCELAQIPYDSFMKLANSYGEEKMSQEKHVKDFFVSGIANGLYWPKQTPTMLGKEDQNIVVNLGKTNKRRRYTHSPYTKNARYAPKMRRIGPDNNYFEITER